MNFPSNFIRLCPLLARPIFPLFLLAENGEALFYEAMQSHADTPSQVKGHSVRWWFEFRSSSSKLEFVMCLPLIDPIPRISLVGLCPPCSENKWCFCHTFQHISRHLVFPSTISAFLSLPFRLSVRSADVISWKACSKIGDQKNRSCSAYSPSRKPGQRKTILDPSSNWYYWRTGLLSSWRG